MSKKYNVSVHCIGFANVEIEAENEAEASAKAMTAHPFELTIEQYTLQQQVVEKVEELS